MPTLSHESTVRLSKMLRAYEAGQFAQKHRARWVGRDSTEPDEADHPFRITFQASGSGFQWSGTAGTIYAPDATTVAVSGWALESAPAVSGEAWVIAQFSGGVASGIWATSGSGTPYENPACLPVKVASFLSGAVTQFQKDDLHYEGAFFPAWFAGYSGTKKQLVGHASGGAVTWYNVGECSGG